MNDEKVPDLAPLYGAYMYVLPEGSRSATSTASLRDAIYEVSMGGRARSPIPMSQTMRCPRCGRTIVRSRAYRGVDEDQDYEDEIDLHRQLRDHQNTSAFCELGRGFRQMLWDGYVPFSAGRWAYKIEDFDVIMGMVSGPYSTVSSREARTGLVVAYRPVWAPLCRVLAFDAWMRSSRLVKDRRSVELVQDCSPWERAAEVQTRLMAMMAWQSIEEVAMSTKEYVARLREAR